MISEVPKWCKVGFYIDAKDNFNEWCVAEVKEITKSQVTVTFNEWAPKWEHTFPIKSPKIAPFRKNSKGYTGSRARTVRSQQLSKDTLASMHSKIRSLMQESMFCEDAFNTTQFYRGKLPSFVEYLLSLNPATEHFPVIFEFLNDSVSLIVNYFRIAPKIMQFFYLGLGNSELYLEDNNVALIGIWYEVIEMLKKLIALENRSPDLYSHVDQSLENRNYILTTSKRTKWSNDLLHHFLTSHGLTYIIEAINTEEEKSRIPFQILNHLPITEIIDLLDTTNTIHLSSKFCQSLLHRAEIITDSELKDLKHEEVLTSFRKVIKYRVYDMPRKIESARLNFCLKMFKSTYLEKRIKGLIEINYTIEQIENRISIYEKSSLELEDFKNFIISEKIVELLIQDRPHVELIKRSAILFKFLARNALINENHLLMLWQSLENKHQSYQKAAFDTIIELASLLEEHQNDFLYSLLSQIPIEKYDDAFLALIKDFTVKAISRSMKSSNTLKTYGLSILKSMILDSSPLDSRSIAIKYLVSIEKETNNEEIKTDLLQTVKNLISSKNSILSALALFLKLVKGCSNISFKNSRLDLILNIFQLTPLIIENLRDYLQQSCIADNSKPFYCLKTKKNIKYRLKFLSCITESVGLSDKSLQELWLMFKDKNFSAKLMFCQWMCLGYNQSFIHHRNLSFIFTNLLLNDLMFPSKCNTTFEFDFFSFYLIEFNRVNNRLEITENRNIKYRKTAKIKGIQKLINIYLNTEEARVQDHAGKLIFNTLNKFDPEIMCDAEEIIQTQVNYLLNLANINKQNPSLVYRVLMLLQVLFDKNDEDLDLNSTIYVKKPDLRDHVQIKINQFRTLRHIRKEVAKQFKIELEKVELVIGEHRYSAKDDDYEIINLRQYWLDIDLLSDHEVYEFQPFNSIQCNQDLIILLFDLVSDPGNLYTDLAWKLLTYLPKCKRLKQDISELKSPLHQVVDRSSTYRLLYALQIILKKSNNQNWVYKFKHLQGFEFIVAVYLEKQRKDKIRLKAFRECVLVQILTNIVDVVNKTSELTKGVFRSFKVVAQAIADGEQMDEDIRSLQCIKKLIKKIHENDDKAIKRYLKENVVEKVLKYALVENNNHSFVEYSVEILQKVASLAKGLKYFLRDCKSLLPDALRTASKTSGFWDLFSSLLEIQLIEDYLPLTNYFLQHLTSHPSEANSSHKDEILSGVLQILQLLISKYPIPIQDSTLHLILETCLFAIPESKLSPSFDPPKCKNSKTRKFAFKLLLELCVKSSASLSKVTSFLDHFHEDPSWRTSRKPDWNISPITKEKSQLGFVGLKNLGCTCYMNSILQQLYMIKTFSQSILKLSDFNDEDNLLYQLKYIFSGLRSSDKQYINPRNFTRAFKDAEGNEINVVEQMDVDEFFASFMDKLENLLKGTEFEDLVKLHFGGVQVTQVIGKECPHRSETCEPFLSISVEVKGKRGLVEGLESYVSEEVLQGEDAYQCDSCEGKVKAVRRVCVKHLPNVLILALRRFEFDFDTMTREKLNDYFEFPFELNMEQFTEEGLDNKSQTLPKDYYLYRLRGIVIHSGSAENGHYYSYIASEHRWVEFNDVWVSLVNPHSIPNDCYGGEEKLHYHPYYKSASREKIGNAYMLIYERKTNYEVRSSNSELSPVDLTEKFKGLDEDLKEVKSQNQKFWRSKIIFAPEYLEFICGLCKIKLTDKKFLAKFLLTVLIRSKDKKEELFEVYERVECDLKIDKEFANWFLDLVSVEMVLRELVLNNPVFMMRKVVVGLVKVAFEEADFGFRKIFFSNFLQNFKYAKKKFTRFFAQYLEILKICVWGFEKSGNQVDGVCLVLQYLTGKNFVEVEPLPHVFDDIYLGYERENSGERVREESLSADSKGTSIGHLVELLFWLRGSIDEVALHVLRQSHMVAYLIQEADNRHSSINTGRLFGHIFKTSSPTDLIQKLLESLKLGESSYKQKISRILLHFLLHQDEHFEEKISSFIDTFFLYIKNCKIVSEAEFNILFLYKLCAKNPKICEILIQKQDLLTYLEKWLRSNIQIIQSVKSDLCYNEEGFKSNTSKNLHSKLEMIKKKTCHLPYDSDEELSDDLTAVGAKIDFYSDGSWMKGSIKARAGDVGLISYSSADEERLEFKDLKSEEVAQYYTKSKTS